MPTYMPMAGAGSLKVLCETTKNLPDNIQYGLTPFKTARFASSARWLSFPCVHKLLNDGSLWCVAVEHSEIRASLYINRKLSDGGIIATTRSVVSDGSVKGIAKSLVSISAFELLKTASMPVSFQAILRVVNNQYDLPSMMSFNKAGYFSKVPPQRVPIDPLDIHLAKDETIKDGCIDVQPLDATNKHISQHADWLLRSWRKI